MLHAHSRRRRALNVHESVLSVVQANVLTVSTVTVVQGSGYSHYSHLIHHRQL